MSCMYKLHVYISKLYMLVYRYSSIDCIPAGNGRTVIVSSYLCPPASALKHRTSASITTQCGLITASPTDCRAPLPASWASSDCGCGQADPLFIELSQPHSFLAYSSCTKAFPAAPIPHPRDWKRLNVFWMQQRSTRANISRRASFRPSRAPGRSARQFRAAGGVG